MANDILTTSVELINQKAQFKGTAKDNPSVIIDYTPPIGDGNGYTSLELLLISLSTCVGSSVSTLLRRMNKNIHSLKINAIGERREQHPLSFQKICLEFRIGSDNLEESDVMKAIKLSEDTFCPVWAMLKNNVEITTSVKIN